MLGSFYQGFLLGLADGSDESDYISPKATTILRFAIYSPSTQSKCVLILIIIMSSSEFFNLEKTKLFDY